MIRLLASACSASEGGDWCSENAESGLIPAAAGELLRISVAAAGEDGRVGAPGPAVNCTGAGRALRLHLDMANATSIKVSDISIAVYWTDD